MSHSPDCYFLPLNDEHYEFLQWLVSEIAEMKGEAVFVSADRVDTMQDAEIVALFDRQRAAGYARIEKDLDDLERTLSSVRKGSESHNLSPVEDRLDRLVKDFDELRGIDFFSSESGRTLQKRIMRARAELKAARGSGMREERVPVISLKSIDRYQGRIWVTRKKPFIDRMASAWLIGKFIDRKARFDFADERDLPGRDRGVVTFDVSGGEFTHVGDLCTFEVLMKSFGLRDRILKKIGEESGEVIIAAKNHAPSEITWEVAELAEQDRAYRARLADWQRRLAREGTTGRAVRLRRAEEAKQKDAALAREALDMFDFRITGRSTWENEPAIIVAFTPRPGVSPRSREGRVARAFAGQAWIHEHEYEVMNVEAKAIDDVSFGWGMIAKLYKGSTARFTRRRINGAWLPVESRFGGTGRALVFRKLDIDFERDYYDYRPFDFLDLPARLGWEP